MEIDCAMRNSLQKRCELQLYVNATKTFILQNVTHYKYFNFGSHADANIGPRCLFLVTTRKDQPVLSLFTVPWNIYGMMSLFKVLGAAWSNASTNMIRCLALFG